MTAEQVVVLKESADDLEQGIDFYESQKKELGSYFFDALMADLESLKISAGIHPVVHDFHRMLSRRFPFAIYYDYDGRIARVLAILDMRSNPAWIRDQLDQRG